MGQGYSWVQHFQQLDNRLQNSTINCSHSSDDPSKFHQERSARPPCFGNPLTNFTICNTMWTTIMPGTLSKGRLWLREWIFSLRNLMFRSINPQCCDTAAQSIWDMYKMFELIDMLSIDIWLKLYKDIPTPLGSDFGKLGHLWSQNDVITSWLRLTANSNYL